MTPKKQNDKTEYLVFEDDNGALGPLVMRVKTVEQVRTLTDTELEQFMWDGGGSEVAFVVFFTDGSFIIPSRDEEANGAGALIYEPATA
jgi:hypothetical protein